MMPAPRLHFSHKLLSGMLVLGLGVASLLSSPTKAQAAPEKPLTAVEHLDVVKYSGPWYEIALIPYFFQKSCALDAKVKYTLLPGPYSAQYPLVYEDYFECQTQKGKLNKMIGRARVVDFQSNARLSATFLKLGGEWQYWFKDNYWVVDLAPDYSHTVVVTPNRKNAWILARTPALSVDTLSGIADKLRTQGVDPCQLRMSPQTGGHQTPTPLCDVIKPE